VTPHIPRYPGNASARQIDHRLRQTRGILRFEDAARRSAGTAIRVL